jgi:quercetin dioxygenase-like cupin family protein
MPKKWSSQVAAEWTMTTVPLLVTLWTMLRRLLIPGFLSAIVAAASALQGQTAPEARTRTLFSQPLPQLDGAHLKVTTVEVTYPPGGASAPHSHPCPVIGYVLRGAVRMQVKGGPVSIFRPGESFYEAPNGTHQVSANASTKEPAVFLAYFVCDHEGPLSVKPQGQ